jgi:methyltransferase (TIGR00027 family)
MRAREAQRADALFRDPHARLLAGARGAREAQRARSRVLFSGVATRTAVFDELVLDAVYHHGARCVLNLGAGLDTRPYRLPLPVRLRWVEADRPAVIDYKSALLADARPACTVERFTVDLADAARRAWLLSRLDAELPTVVLTEGVLMYLATADVTALASDLAGAPTVRWWALDLSDDRLARWATGMWSRPDARNPAPRFAARDAEFFRPLGWEPIAVHSSWTERRRVGREPLLMRAAWAVSPAPVRRSLRRLGTFVLLARR